MNIDNIDELKERYKNFEEVFKSEKYNEAVKMLDELINDLTERMDVRRAAHFEKNGHISISSSDTDKKEIYISLNHVMEYYLYVFYYKPDADVLCTDIPIGEYLRTYGGLCIKLAKYNAAKEAFIQAIEWNPMDLDAILGLAECYKYLGMNDRYLEQTKNAYRLCCTRATMARYYRNMGYINVSKYNTELARACYIYSNIYYHTENADNELKYLETALNDKTPDYSIKDMQKMFDENGIEPGPDSDTIGIIYRVGELMMHDNEYKLAKDCFSIVYDITGEKKLEALLDELEKVEGGN